MMPLSSSGSDVSETTHLMMHRQRSAASGPYMRSSTSPLPSSTSPHLLDTATAARECVAGDHYRRLFHVPGSCICVHEAVIIHCHPLGRWLPRLFPSRVTCQAVSAVMNQGKLHAIVDVDGAAARALVMAAAGEVPVAAGDIYMDGAPVSSATRRRVGVVSRSTAAVPDLSVRTNLRFVVDMRTRGGEASWKTTLVEAAAAFVGLDADTRVSHLSVLEMLLLRIAMELVLDPPALILCDPFVELDYSSQVHATHVLERVCSVLHKTVLVATRQTLAPHFFERTHTTLLFGAQGQVLYSGLSSRLAPYFNALRILPYQGATSSSSTVPTMVGSRTSTPHKHRHDHSRHLSGGSGCRFYSTPRISQQLFPPHDTPDTPAGRDDPTSDGCHEGCRPTGCVVVRDGSDALDLAVEWADNEKQTLFYAAKYYDSNVRQEITASVVADLQQLGAERTGTAAEGDGDGAAPQRSIVKPFILMRHLLRQLCSQPELLYGTACSCIGIATVSLLMHYQSEDQGGMYNIRGVLFLLFLLALLVNETTLYNARGQLRLFLHQRNRGLYSTWCFVVCLVLQVVLVRLIYLVLFVPFVISVVRASPLVVSLVGAVSVVHALVLYACHASAPLRIARLLCHVYFGYSLLCSGFLLNLLSMPRVFGYLSVMRWGYGPALRERLDGNPFSCDGAGNTSYCYTGDDYLAVEGLGHDSFLRAWLVLTAMGLTMIAVLSTALSMRRQK